MTPYPMAASVATAPVLAGVRRRVEAVTVTPQAVYFATGDPDLPALCLCDPDAVRVPCALILGQPLPALPTGVGWVGDGWAGDGRLSLGSFEARVGRWWRPPRPRGLGRAAADRPTGFAADQPTGVAADQPTGVAADRPTGVAADRLGALAAELAQRVPRLAADTATELTRLVHALTGGGPLSAPVIRLLGRGPGLTPLGDDILAGALVTLGALGSPAFHRLGAAVCALAPGRTPFVSAALLHHAARGECVPELAAVLTTARQGPAVAQAIGAVLGVGASSGAGLAHGVRAALAVDAALAVGRGSVVAAP